MPSDWSTRKLQFRVLYRVFLMRVVDLELLAADADPSKLIGQFATIFATVSFLFTLPSLLILMGGHRLPATDAWIFEHFLIETTMTVAGVITVLNWDSAFPDRRDVLVLAPLPVRTSTLFLAKIAALFAAPCLAMIALNVFSGLTWPLVFSGGKGGLFSLLRALPAYWITIFIAGGFIVFAVLAVQGLAANLLPRRLFLQVSAFLQAAALCLLLMVYLLGPSLESPAALTAPQNQRLLAWLPSYWFLGLFQQLNGSMHPALVPLARRAWIGLAVSVLGAAAALLLSYFRMLPKTVEQPDILPGARSRRWAPLFGNSLNGAITVFSLRTLLRSRQHRMILSFYVGIGLAIVVGYIRTPVGRLGLAKTGVDIAFLLASILTMILTILAIRVVASIPIAACKLDHPRHSSAIGPRLPASGSLLVACVRRGPGLAHRCGPAPGCLPLAASSRTSRCHVVRGDTACRVLPVHLSQDSLHLLLPAGQSKYSLRILGLPDVVHTLAQRRSRV